MDVSLGADGGCTGLQWLVDLTPWREPITACCLLHDAGGTDGGLLDCLQSVVPTWLWPLAAFAVAVMVLGRPAYRWLQGKGWAK